MPLHTACRYGYTAIAQILMDAGANVHVKDIDGWTPRIGIDAACYHNRKEIVQLLIRYGVDWLADNDVFADVIDQKTYKFYLSLLKKYGDDIVDRPCFKKIVHVLRNKKNIK